MVAIYYKGKHFNIPTSQGNGCRQEHLSTFQPFPCLLPSFFLIPVTLDSSLLQPTLLEQLSPFFFIRLHGNMHTGGLVEAHYTRISSYNIVTRCSCEKSKILLLLIFFHPVICLKHALSHLGSYNFARRPKCLNPSRGGVS